MASRTRDRGVPGAGADELAARDRAAIVEHAGGPRRRDDVERGVLEAPERRPGVLVADLDGATTGIVTLDRRDPELPVHVHHGASEAALGYLFLPQAWGHGYAAEACAAALDRFAGALPGETGGR